MINLDKILKGHKLWLESIGKEGTRADLSEANLSEADLSEADLSGANLYRANLYMANLSGVNFFEANLSRANLSGANLSVANLSGANLSFTKGKTIYQLNGPQHQAFLIAEDKICIIGCKCMGIDKWLELGEQIGQENHYSDAEIKLYLDFIRRNS